MKKGKIILLCIAALFLGAGLFFALRYYFDYKVANFSGKYVLYVYPDMGMDEALACLETGAGTLRPGSMERCALKVGLNQEIKPGRYVVDSSMTSIYVARMLRWGWQTPQMMTLSGTLRTKSKIASLIGRQMMVDSLTVDSLLNNETFLSRYGFTPENVFALFLPDTYEFFWTATPEEIFSRFRKEYDDFWTQERLTKASRLKLTPLEVSILASIVSGETTKDFEYPKIAGVYLNRLRSGMKLQADPTVAFCFDYSLNRILKVHTQVDSPYNTYKYAGLPPAPINVPPKECIDAVLNPDTHGYLYFCASDAFDGTHRFAVTYREHLVNARAFQRELSARQRAAAKK